jgi:sugar phosphate isomerase/epimerase
MWKFNVNTVAFMRFPLERTFELISEGGFVNVELGESHFDIFKLTKSEFRNIMELLNKNGLKLCSVFAEYGYDAVRMRKYSFGISSPREEDREVAVKEMKRLIETAVELECDLIVSELTGDRDDPERSKKSFIKSVNEIIPTLDQTDSTMVVEAHPGDFMEDAFTTIDILRSFGSKRIRYNYCVPHTFILGHTPKEIIIYSREILTYCHVADSLNPNRIFFSPAYSPKIKPHLHLIPGLGDVDFMEYISTLKEIKFGGVLTLDAFSHMDRPLAAMIETRRRVESY